MFCDFCSIQFTEGSLEINSSWPYFAQPLDQSHCHPEHMCTHWQNQGVYSQPGPLHFESLPSWRALFMAGYGRLTARLTTTADDDWCLQIYSSAAYSFCTLLSVWERMYVGERWCKQAGMAAFFKSGRVVWTVTLRLRCLHGSQSKVSDPCICVYCMHSCATLITSALLLTAQLDRQRLIHSEGKLSDCTLFADQCPLL